MNTSPDGGTVEKKIRLQDLKLDDNSAGNIARNLKKLASQENDRFYKDKRFAPEDKILEMVAKHNKEIDKFEKEIQDTKNQLKQKTQEFDDVNEKLRIATKQIANQNNDNTRDLQVCQQAKRDLENQIKSFNRTITTLNDEKEQKEEYNKKLVQLLDEGQQKQLEIQEKLDTATTNLNTQLEEKTKLLNQIETLTGELKELREQGKVSESNKIKLQQTMEELATCNSNGQKHIKEIQTLQNQLTEAKQQIEVINQQNFEEQIANLKMALENDKNAKAKAEQDFQTQIAQLTLEAKQAQEVADKKADDNFKAQVIELKESSKNEAQQDFLQKLKALKINIETAKRENKSKAEEEFIRQIAELKRKNEELNIRLANEDAMSEENNKLNNTELEGLKASIENLKARAYEADGLERQQLENKDKEINKLKKDLADLRAKCPLQYQNPTQNPLYDPKPKVNPKDNQDNPPASAPLGPFNGDDTPAEQESKDKRILK